MAITIYIATDMNGGTQPDLGPALAGLLVNTVGNHWVGSLPAEQGGDSIAIEDINSIQIGASSYRLYAGQVTSQALFDEIESALGSNHVKNGKDALTSPFRGRIESIVPKVQRISNGAEIGFQARTGISGNDLVRSTLDETDDPDDVETVPPA